MKIEEEANTYKETARLANVRFQGGVTSFLEVLVTEQQYFSAELNLLRRGTPSCITMSSSTRHWAGAGTSNSQIPFPGHA